MKPSTPGNLRKYEAVAAGHLCLDIFPGFSQNKGKPLSEIFCPGKLTRIENAELSVGGSVTNTGIVLNRLGIATMLMGLVGDDTFGRALLEIIEEWDSDAGYIKVRSDVSTSYSIMMAIPGVDKIALHYPGANDSLFAGDIDYDEVSSARLFHFGYPVLMKKMFEDEGQELLEILRNVKKRDLTVSLDMAPVDPASDAGKADWGKILENVLPLVDFFMPSLEETMYMLRKKMYLELLKKYPGRDLLEMADLNIIQELGEELAGLGAKTVVLKCGGKGAYVLTSGRNIMAKTGKAAPADLNSWSSRELFQAAYQPERMVSATGCGDSFIAGFLACLLKGDHLEDALRMGCACGAESVSASDNISGVMPLEATREKIKKGWPLHQVQISGGYWSFSSGAMNWKGKRDVTISNSKY